MNIEAPAGYTLENGNLPGSVAYILRSDPPTYNSKGEQLCSMFAINEEEIKSARDPNVIAKAYIDFAVNCFEEAKANA